MTEMKKGLFTKDLSDRWSQYLEHAGHSASHSMSLYGFKRTVCAALKADGFEVRPHTDKTCEYDLCKDLPPLEVRRDFGKTGKPIPPLSHTHIS